MLIYTNKKQMYVDLEITRHKFEKYLKEWKIIELHNAKWKFKWYLRMQDVVQQLMYIIW